MIINYLFVDTQVELLSSLSSLLRHPNLKLSAKHLRVFPMEEIVRVRKRKLSKSWEPSDYF